MRNKSWEFGSKTINDSNNNEVVVKREAVA